MRNFTSRLLNNRVTHPCPLDAELMARQNTRPLGNVDRTDPKPERTRQQDAMLEALSLSYDEVVGELKPNGWLEVRATTYDAGSRCVNFIDVAPDGVPHDT